MKVSLILPCYNPQDGWEKVVEKHLSLLFKQTPEIAWEIILVDDGSQVPPSKEAIAFLQQRLPLKYFRYEENRGKGYALRYGTQRAQGTFVIFTDIDIPYGAKGVLAILHALQEQNADLAIGNRDESYLQNIPRSRRWISKMLRWIMRWIFRLPYDTQCGLKGYNQKGKQIMLNTQIDTFLIDIELIRDAKRSGLKIIPVDVYLRSGVEVGAVSNKTLWREAKQLVKLFFKKPNVVSTTCNKCI